MLAVDCSQKAVALARANAELNGVDERCTSKSATAFKRSMRWPPAERFGAIVLDPPKFARSRAAVDDALLAYHRLNRLAVDLLEPGGILVTCSCSGHVTREDFLHMLVGVAEAKRGATFKCSSSAGPPRIIRSAHLPGKRISQVLHLPRGVESLTKLRRIANLPCWNKRQFYTWQSGHEPMVVKVIPSETSMLKVKLPDGSVREYKERVRPIDVAAEIGPGLAKATMAAEAMARSSMRPRPLPSEGEVAAAAADQERSRGPAVMRHSCAHVMARAVMRLFDGVQLAFGPTTDNGFYYDFELPHKLSEEDFPAIEAEMAKIIKLDEPFERLEEPRDKALAICRDLGQTLKVEHIEKGLADQPTLSFYRQGEFIDLCRGPHIPSAGAIGAFKLLRSPGPIGKATPSRAAVAAALRHRLVQQGGLENYLKMVEEAKRRDHRVLGKQLELFTTNPLVGPGLILWLPKGATIRGLLENFVRDELTRRGYRAGLHAEHRPGRAVPDLGPLSRITPTASSSRS